MLGTTIRRLCTALAATAALAVVATPASAEAKASHKTRSCVPRGDAIIIPLPWGGRLGLVDRDGDRRYENVFIDIDGDGKWDAGGRDCDGDGKVDVRWVDKDGNGKIDKGEVERVPKPARKREACTKTKNAGKERCQRAPWRMLGYASMNRLVRQLPHDRPTQQPGHERPGQQQPQDEVRPVLTPYYGERLNMEVDIDGDGEAETVNGDGSMSPSNSYGKSLDGDRDHDVVVVGTKDGTRVAGKGNVDNDPGDEEIIVEDPNLPPKNSYGIDLDGDGDIDIVVVGTKGGAKVSGTRNVDNDPGDTEVIVCDPSLRPNQSYGIDLDVDRDHDVMVDPPTPLAWVEVGDGAASLADADGDGDWDRASIDTDGSGGPSAGDTVLDGVIGNPGYSARFGLTWFFRDTDGDGAADTRVETWKDATGKAQYREAPVN